MAKRIFLVNILRLLLLCFLMIDAVAASLGLSKSSCRGQCGNITIPFPFGIGRPDCFLDEWYEIDCKNATIPFLKKLNLQVLNISLWTLDGRGDDGHVTVNFPIIYSNPNCSPNVTTQPPSLQGSPFIFSSLNIFAAVGCNVNAVMINSNPKYPERISSVGCELKCSGGNFPRNTTCSGFDNCCLNMVPSDLRKFNVSFINPEDATGTNDQPCNYALLANESWLRPSFTDLDSLKMEGYVPVVLIWGISNVSDLAEELYHNGMYDPKASYMCGNFYNTYDLAQVICSCRYGYGGNPYLIGGCQDIDECEEEPRYCYPDRCVNTPGSYHCVDPRKSLKLILIRS